VSPARDSGLPARNYQPEHAPCVIPPSTPEIFRLRGRYAPPIVIVIVVVLAVASPAGQVMGVLYALATVLALAGMRERLA
jgi:hypothetical protein